ncbi:MAG: aminotransferase class V-fold PLP-dependent enzyme [Burkholderiales bacterium]|nr:aminotransferase class V-fold PLP-dependent enzyme [Burkholderiales bacterium]
MIEGPLTEEALRRAVWPQFSRTLAEYRGIYLANHSLGRPPDRAAEDVRAALDAWYRDMDGAWEHWFAAREKFRALVARLVGAPRADCIVPKASAGQGLRAVLSALPERARVVATDGEFDSLDFILRVWRDRGRIELRLVPWRELSAAGADLLVVSTVQYRTGEVVEGLPQLVRAAHAQGARVLLDVYHHAGALPLDLAALGADFAVGGSYKYTRGGPGRPGSTCGRTSSIRFARSTPAGSQRRRPSPTNGPSRRALPRAATAGSSRRRRCSRRRRRSPGSK